MKIAVLGSGNIGKTLGIKWLQAGYEVMFGVRDTRSPKVKAFRAAQNRDLLIATMREAIGYGEVILFAVPGNAVAAIADANAPALDRKILIDATNKVGAVDMSNIAALIARAPHARVFRAFNSLGWENFAQPLFREIQADLIYCGSDDAIARPAVEELIRAIGLRPVCAGGLEKVAIVDGVTRLWFALAHEQGMGRHLAFKVLQS